MAKTFKERLTEMDGRFSGCHAREDILYDSVRETLDRSVEMYGNDLNRICSTIAQHNYKNIMKTAAKLEKKRLAAMKKEEKEREGKNGTKQ